MTQRRDDYGAAVDGFFRKQPPALRAILDELRGLIAKAVPDATATLKWGQPFYSVGDGVKGMVCALGAHKAHVNLILSGPPGTFADPGGRLVGEGKTGRHLPLRDVSEIPKKEVLAWLRAAVANAKA